MNVFVLQHVRVLQDDAEETKMIGVYSTEQHGRQAIAALLDQPGFREFSDGFHLDAYEVDQTHWREGFVTLRSRV